MSWKKINKTVRGKQQEGVDVPLKTLQGFNFDFQFEEFLLASLKMLKCYN